MLDTNAVSDALKNGPVAARIGATPLNNLCLSAVSEAELLYGVYRKPDRTNLNAFVREFLQKVRSLPWDSEAADAYGRLRTRMETAGKSLARPDMLIAAHAIASGLTLVSNDSAFRHVPELALEDWTQP
jgi:tRNA(fMet)-specific endonuclease VapC